MWADPPIDEQQLLEYVLAVTVDSLKSVESGWRNADNPSEAAAQVAVSAVWKVLKRANIRIQPRFGDWP